MRRWISTFRFLPEVAICFLLSVAILIVYFQVRGFEFVNFDDFAYVVKNHTVRKGLSWESIYWAFHSIAIGNWHPLTMVSHMVDVELYGMDAGGHHWNNVLLHVANSLLLFWVLRSMTGSVWRSALAAGLFALHPLHVESVAWVSERKDVLSTFFLMLTLWSYTHYVRKSKIYWYILTFLFSTLGLMAKPMLVTLPFMLLLLDFWPFQRIIYGEKGNWGKVELNPRVLREKTPFLFLTLVFSVVTFVVQKKTGGVESLHVYPLFDRVANVIVSYALYLGKTVCPINLSVFYPRPTAWPWWQIFGSLVLIGLLSWISIRSVKKCPWLFVGWFWFVGTLVPVIGIVQVGLQAMADRYAYIPLIGIFIAFSWSVFEVFNKFQFPRGSMVAFASILLANLMLGSFFQAEHWKNTRTLFENAVSVDPGNYLAHSSLGSDLIQNGEIQRGLSHIRTALQLNPNDSRALYEMGLFFFNTGETDKAVHHFSESIKLNPYHAESHNNLGVISALQGNTAEALMHFEKAIEIRPQMIEAYHNLGSFWAKQGKYDDAITNFKKILELVPDDQKAVKRLAAAIKYKQENRKHFEKDDSAFEKAVEAP